MLRTSNIQPLRLAAIYCVPGPRAGAGSALYIELLVNSPIVIVNGKYADVLAAVGYPSAVDSWQVNFRAPLV